MADLNHVLVNLGYVDSDLVELIGNSDRYDSEVLYFVDFSCGSTRPHGCVAKFISYVNHREIEDVVVRLS